jgi:alkanesulfonate monooxygenase SsuD/methylene tetrahydromethanopterin reductase-like flavin-dependent oxidoreductase (luciferase family)
MKFGLQVSSFTYPGGTPELAPTLERIVRTADGVGFDSIWVMDHFFQIRGVGPAEEPMLEGWTALGWIAALTQRARIKAATTLDVLSGGRAWLGLGAAWNQAESEALGFPFPPLRDRFEMLEETLQMAHAMFEGEMGSQGEFHGRQYDATRLMNSPQSLSRPRVPIMIGGGGEQKTLRLVAQYADATNVFGGPEMIHHKYEVLRGHCEAIGRPFEDIERSNLQSVRISPDGAPGTESPAEVVDRFGELSDAGAQQIIFSLRDAWDTSKIELLGSSVLPQLRDA